MLAFCFNDWGKVWRLALASKIKILSWKFAGSLLLDIPTNYFIATLQGISLIAKIEIAISIPISVKNCDRRSIAIAASWLPIFLAIFLNADMVQPLKFVCTWSLYIIQIFQTNYHICIGKLALTENSLVSGAFLEKVKIFYWYFDIFVHPKWILERYRVCMTLIFSIIT